MSCKMADVLGFFSGLFCIGLYHFVCHLPSYLFTTCVYSFLSLFCFLLIVAVVSPGSVLLSLVFLLRICRLYFFSLVDRDILWSFFSIVSLFSFFFFHIFFMYGNFFKCFLFSHFFGFLSVSFFSERFFLVIIIIFLYFLPFS